MKSLPLFFSLAAAFFLAACGRGPEPEYLEGEERAVATLTEFLTAVQQSDEAKAKSLMHSKPDYIIRDFEGCREYFFERRPTGKKVLETGHQYYGGEWQIFVDMQINYGPEMKQLHFILDPGTPPKLRGVLPIVPDLR